MTRQQQAVFNCIQQYFMDFSRQPTLAEIGFQLSLARSTVHAHVQKLIAQGFLKPGEGKAAYHLEQQPDRFRLPLLGRIAAGQPIEAIENQDYLDLAEHFCGPERYVLRVSGDSMIEAGILDDDYVVIRKQETANVGDIIVALVNDFEVTLKYFYPQSGNHIELRPANSSMASMYYPANQVKVQGVMVGLIRDHPQLRRC